MWFRSEAERVSKEHRYLVTYTVTGESGPQTIRTPVRGQTEARKQAELLSSAFQKDILVYGEDAQGEFLLGTATQAATAADADSPELREMYAKTVEGSLEVKDKLLLDLSPATIQGFAQMATSFGYFADAHKKIAKAGAEPHVSYPLLYQTLMQRKELPASLTIPYDPLNLGILSEQLSKKPVEVHVQVEGQGTQVLTMDFMVFPEIRHLGQKGKAALSRTAPGAMTYTLDGQTNVVRPRPVFKGHLPGQPEQDFLVVLEREEGYGNNTPVAMTLLGKEEVLQSAANFMLLALANCSPFKNRLVLVNRGQFDIYTKPPKHLTWTDIVPNPSLKAELDLVTRSIEQQEELSKKGLDIKRGVLISGPPGVGKSASINATIEELMGKTTIFLVESVGAIRQVYSMALMLTPAVIIFEDLDLITVNRSHYEVSKDSATGELLQVLSGTTEYKGIITVATTNHPEKIDEALTKRAGRFDVHLKVAPPTTEEKVAILDLYMKKLEVSEFVQQGVRKIFREQLADLPIVGAHIEEFVKVGVKRQMLKDDQPSWQDFQPGVEAIKSISKQKNAA